MTTTATETPTQQQEWDGMDTTQLFRELRAATTPERQERIRDQLILMHGNLVRYLARKFANRGEPLEDLIQVGTIGLINAVDRFEPDRHIKFSTYAVPTIIGEIRRYFRDKGWNLKVPRRLKELNLAANRAIEQLSQEMGRSPTYAEIAESVGATEEEISEALEMGSAYHAVSLDTELSDDTESAKSALLDLVGETDESFRRVELYAQLKDAIQTLPERERNIVHMRFFKEMSQTEVAKKLGISQMHVSRLQQKALNQLKEVMMRSE
ncbi:MAG: RNA polymerase sigma factor SigF [Armatimonadetes bacterium]|nr:RNA polymerase sigma factor SigF [Armatimonadota bacterium]